MKQDMTQFYISKSVADNTRRTYESVRKKFNGWLQRNQLRRSDINLARYLSEIHATSKHRAQSLCEVTVAAERWFTKRTDKPSAVGPLTESVTDGIRRYSTASRGQVKGLLWEQADQVCDKQLRTNTLSGLRNAALICLGSDCLLRPSELQAVCVEHLTLDFKSDRSTLWIPRAKTDQFSEGTAMHVGTPTAMVLFIWMRMSGIREGKVFRRVYAQERVIGTGCSTNAVRTMIQHSIKAAGFEGYYGGQSLRVGSAQSLALANVSLAQIMHLGRWESEKMVVQYIKHIVPHDAAVSRKRYR